MSALVHSSTLVTAGVYLLVRFHEVMAHRTSERYILIVGTLTITIAGLRAIFEIDMKKIVALSTLSQLGLIMASLGLSLRKVAFFHLLTHAYFKALLFIAVGNIIHLSRRFQDLRIASLSSSFLNSTLAFRLTANMRLCGFPFLRGFYSKDIFLELSVLNYSSFGIRFIFFFATALTSSYTARFLCLCLWRSSEYSHLSLANDRRHYPYLGMNFL